MKLVRVLATVTLMLTLLGLASAQTWTPLKNTTPLSGAGTMLQLRDGRVLVHDGDASDWAILTPDAKGSYVNGTWSSGGSLPSTYGPLYYGSQVLLNGRQVVIEGGEYNLGAQIWTNMGAIGTVTPFSGPLTWKLNSPPSGWANIGDAQSVKLADGRYLQASCCFSNSRESAFFKGPNSWDTSPGLIIGPNNDEGSYTLLPSGKLLMVDAWSTTCSSTTSTELFNPSTKSWSCGADTPTELWDSSGHELGPANMMYNGKLFQVGATNATAVYNPTANTWAPGPIPANGLTGYDAPGAVLPNGTVLEMLGPPAFANGCEMELYNPTTNKLSSTANPPQCPGDPSYVGHFMLLPTGQVMFTDFSNNVQVYTPAGGVATSAIPKITSTNHTFLFGSKNNLLSVTNLNGLSQGAAYGDDYQPDTNYPLVRLKSSTGNVTYAFTHDDSTHSIAPNTKGTTKFDLPTTLKRGNYSLYVVANGIPSAAFLVKIQ